MILSNKKHLLYLLVIIAIIALTISISMIISRHEDNRKLEFQDKEAYYVDGRFPMHVIDLSENIIIKNTPAKVVFKVAVTADTDSILISENSKYRDTYDICYGKYTFQIIESRVECKDMKYQSDNQKHLKIKDINISLRRINDFDFAFSNLEVGTGNSRNQAIYGSSSLADFEIIRTDKHTGEKKNLSYKKNILFGKSILLDDQGINTKGRFSDDFYDRLIKIESGKIKKLQLENLMDCLSAKITFQNELNLARTCKCEFTIDYTVENLYNPEKSYSSSYSEDINLIIEKSH